VRLVPEPRTDAFACEPQFLDHLAPIWRALPPEARGTFWVAPALTDRAGSRGIVSSVVDAGALRRRELPPRARPGPGPRALVASIGDIKVARRLGYRRFAFMEHGAGQAYTGDKSLAVRRHSSYAGGLDREDNELIMVPNEYSARLWREAYPLARTEVVGSPVLDDLPRRDRRDDTPPVVAISFHWPALVTYEARSAVGHFQPALADLARAYTVIGHAHPKGDWPARMARTYARYGIPFVEDFDEVCRRADVYAVDNSSTLFEFAATGRPVVVLNAPWYRRNVNHGLRFWDAATVGLNCDRPGDLVRTIAEALTDPPSVQAAREAALDKVYSVRSGAAERAARAVVAWLAADLAEAV